MTYFLQSGDFVGVSFWIVYAAMVASTVFFFYEGMAVKKEWRLSLTVAGLVTLVAAIHYDYMRDFWVAEQATPIVYRYIDWLITVPLLMIEFYIILKAVGASVSISVRSSSKACEERRIWRPSFRKKTLRSPPTAVLPDHSYPGKTTKRSSW